MSKKILSAVLAVMMVLTMFPMAAMAATTPTELTVTVATTGAITVKNSSDEAYTGTALKYAVVETDPSTAMAAWDADTTDEAAVKTDLSVDALTELTESTKLEATDNDKFLVVVDINTNVVAAGSVEITGIEADDPGPQDPDAAAALTVTVGTDGTITVKGSDGEAYTATGTLKYALVEETKATAIAAWTVDTTETAANTALGVTLSETEPELTIDDNDSFLVVVDVSDESKVVAAGESAAIAIEEEEEKSNVALVQTVLGKIVSFVAGEGTKADPKTGSIGVDYKTAVLKSTNITISGADLALYSDVDFTEAVNDETGLELTAGEETVAYIKVTAEDETTEAYFAVSITRAEPKTDAKVATATVAGITATVPADGGADAANATEIEVSVPKDTTTGTVVLTVDADATVKTGTAAEAINTAQVNTDGTVTIEGATLNGLYIEVTAQDGTTKKYYKIAATEVNIVVEAPTPETDLGEFEADSSALNTPLTNTTADSESLTANAFEIAQDVNVESAKEELAEALDQDVADLSDVYIHAVPSVEVTVMDYDETKQEYEVDITPYITIIASTEALYANVETGEAGKNAVVIGEEKTEMTISTPVDVEIGVPTTIANDSEYVYVTHEGDPTVLRQVSSGKVTITLGGFSKVRITPATDAQLSDLYLTTGVLEPTFDPNTTDYTATVANGTTSIQVMATAADGLTNPVITYNNEVSNTITGLVVGENTIVVKIAADGGLDPVEYTIVVTVLPADINHPDYSGDTVVSNTIKTTAPANGTLTTSANAAKEGDTVTVTATANTGYVVAGVTVTDASGNNVAVSGSNGTYTFTMPKTAVTVTANIVTLFSQFTDVPANEYYADAVKWAVENGITLGTSATTFSPGNPCSRKEMVLFLYRVKGKPAVNGTPSFTDVSGTAYDAYRDAIKWAVDSGITKGTGDGTTFEPDKACSRSEMVTFLHRLNGTPAVTGTNGFVDVASDAYFKDAVQWAATNGITVGAGSADVFNPFGVCSRGEMALFLQRNSKL